MGRSTKLPIAFMSYVRFDDQHEDGRLTDFCAKLSAEVRMQTGRDFPIFQDRSHIKWGENWLKRILESLDATTFLIPIITPSFFKSPYCRQEVLKFLEREQKLQRDDLILPMYYVGCPEMDSEAKRKKDEVVQLIASRNYSDWRELRFEPFTAPGVAHKLADMAVQIRDALEAVRNKTASRTGNRHAIPLTHGSADSEVSATAELKNGHSAGAVGGPTILEPIEVDAPRTTAKTDPRSRVVDPINGPYHSITQAIKAATPGDRILVRPGVYREGLVIDKPLEVLGEGDADVIVVEATGQNALLFRTTMGRVANLTLKQKGGTGSWFAVHIGQGHLVLEGCRIASQSLSGVGIHNQADPILRRNRISGCKQSGIFIYEEGQGTLEDNEITGNELNGITFSGKSTPTLRRNAIHGNTRYGVNCHSQATSVLEENDIHGNGMAGIAVWKKADPVIRRNRIHDNSGPGIFVYEQGTGRLDDNDIYRNKLAGIEIKDGGNPVVRYNRIVEGHQVGVLAHSGGKGIIEANDIRGNTYAGIEIKMEADPIIRNNRIHEGKASGIYVQTNGSGLIEVNEVFTNTKHGLLVTTGGTPVVRYNRIHHNKNGVYVQSEGHGLLEENEITENLASGIVTESDGEPIARSNRLAGNGAYGVDVRDGGAGTFEKNTISDNRTGNWCVSENASSKLNGNPVPPIKKTSS